jgi:hypothetical protein
MDARNNIRDTRNNIRDTRNNIRDARTTKWMEEQLKRYK